MPLINLSCCISDPAAVDDDHFTRRGPSKSDSGNRKEVDGGSALTSSSSPPVKEFQKELKLGKEKYSKESDGEDYVLQPTSSSTSTAENKQMRSTKGPPGLDDIPEGSEINSAKYNNDNGVEGGFERDGLFKSAIHSTSFSLFDVPEGKEVDHDDADGNTSIPFYSSYKETSNTFYSSYKETTLTKEELTKIPDQVKEILGDDYQKDKNLHKMVSSMSKILDVCPWDTENIDEKVVQMLLHVLLSAQSQEFELSFFEALADDIGGPNWIANEEAGYGKTFILTDKNIKVGLYRWNKGCIANIHDHGKETVAFYSAVGSNSRLMNKVYEKKPTDEDPTKIEKEYDEILDGSSSIPVGILRARHAHAIQNLSNSCSYTIHIYVPSYDFGLTWDYEDRASVSVIRQSLLTSFMEQFTSTSKELSKLKMSVRRSMIQDG